MEIEPLGDAALIVRVVDNFDTDPDAALRSVLRARDGVVAADLPGVIDVAPAYATVGVFYDPPRIASYELFVEQVRSAAASRRAKAAHKSRVVDVPVCYEREFATDLQDVARHCGLAAEEVVRRHTRAKYRVSCVGFTPGFPYLTGLPAELAMPRRATPRTQVPAGSVAIGGSQTGIYPQVSPGGWNVIGRTPLCLFDPARAAASLLQAGDEVRFRAINREEFTRVRDAITR